MEEREVWCSELKKAAKGASALSFLDQLGREDGAGAREDGPYISGDLYFLHKWGTHWGAF